MPIKNFQCAKHSLVSATGPTMIAPGGKLFKIRLSGGLENTILRLVFANAVLHKISILLMFCKQNSQVCCTFRRIQSLL